MFTTVDEKLSRLFDKVNTAWATEPEFRHFPMSAKYKSNKVMKFAVPNYGENDQVHLELFYDRGAFGFELHCENQATKGVPLNIYAEFSKRMKAINPRYRILVESDWYFDNERFDNNSPKTGGRIKVELGLGSANDAKAVEVIATMKDFVKCLNGLI